MGTRLALAAAVVSMLGFVVWLAVTGTDGPGARSPAATASGSADAGAADAGPAVPDSPNLDLTGPTSAIVPVAPGRAAGTHPSEASTVPCRLPLAWRIAQVDEEFGLDPARAERAIGEAAALWAAVAGRALFVHDSAGGFPIRFVHDERQARTRERRRLEAELRAERREVGEADRELAGEREAHVRAVDRYRKRAADFRERLSLHNETVADWNRRGDIPEEVAGGFRRAEAELTAEDRALRRRAAELAEAGRRLREDEERLGERRRALDDRARELERRFPPTEVEAGRYREAILRDGDRVVDVRREIRIFRFADLEELPIVVAHELGHALGLDHDTVPGSLMNDRYGLGEPGERRPAVPSLGTERIRALCRDR